MASDMKIKRSLVHEQVFEYMKNAIKNKQWKVNEKIPSEVELSESFGVNRLTIRMAIQRLGAIGLVETRHGDGTYVKEFSFTDLIDQVSVFYMSPELLDNVYEFRKTVEVACARLAMDHATEEELERLLELCNDYEQAKRRVPREYNEELLEELVNKDIAIHQQVCIMSHNILFSYFFEVAREPIYHYLRVILKKRIDQWLNEKVDVTSWRDLHQVVYESIRDKDEERCRQAYFQMVDRNVEVK